MQLKTAQTDGKSRNFQFQKLCDKFLSPTVSQFVKIQVHHHKNSNRNLGYSNELKHMCLSLYFSGPKAYNMFSKIFKLLSKRTRQRITKNVKFSPGFQQQVFDILKIKANTLWFIRIHIFNFFPHSFINLMNWMGTVLFVLMKLALRIFYFIILEGMKLLGLRIQDNPNQ